MLTVQLIRIKGGISEEFRIDNGVRHGCIESPWLFNVYKDGGEDRDGKEGSELPGEWEGGE